MSETAAETTSAKTAAAATETAKTGEEAAKTSAGTTAAATTETATKSTEKTDAVKEKTFTQAEFDRALEKKTKDLEKAAAAEAAKAKLSEDEKKDATISELQNSLRMRDAKDDVVAALEKAGTKATGLMWNAIKGELEFDDKGKLTNLDSLVKDLQAEYPDQFGIPKPEGGIDAAGKPAGGDALTKEKLAKMTPAEISKLPWEEVKKVMAQP